MKHKAKLVFRVFIVLFTLSVSVAVIPCGIIHTYGLFGEVKTSTVIKENREETAEARAAVRKINTVKRTNKYNIWFKLAIVIICLIYAAYEIRLPRRHTIVTLKVRMNN